MKRNNMSWKDISIAVDIKVNTLKQFYKRHKAIEGLPPKVKVSRRLINRRNSLFLKNYIFSNKSINTPGQ